MSTPRRTEPGTYAPARIAAAAEAAVALTLSLALVKTLPFARVARLTGLRHEPGVNVDGLNLAVSAGSDSAAVQWAVGAAAARLPWPSSCLVRAVAAVLLLRRRGVAATLYLGVAREPGTEVEAHAWVRVGEAIVTGASDHERYAVVGQFTTT